MTENFIQSKLNEAREALENAVNMGWECKILTDEYPIKIVFVKNEMTLYEIENKASVIFTFTHETATAINWDNVEIKEVKKLKDMAESYALLYLKWFFMQFMEESREEHEKM